MNGKTLEKTPPKGAAICGLSLKSIKEVTTFLRHSVQNGRENRPAQSLALQSIGKTFGARSVPTRVKAAAKHNNHAIPSVLIERGVERGGNMGLFCGDQPALLPQGELK